MHPSLSDTLTLVKNAHGKYNALDKGGKVPYYWHLVRVMLRLNTDDIELLQIALLHDVVEDTDITLDNLKDLGYSNRVIEGVRWSSKNMFTLSFAEWMRAIGKEAPDDTILLKIADISDNLGFERMRGLMTRSSKSPSKPKKQFNLREKIDRKIEKKMRLHGEMGVYDRYYKGWNCMFENSNRLHLIEKVYLGDFCHLEQLKKLAEFLPQNELLTYLQECHINTWKHSGKLEIIKDSLDNDYIAVNIPGEQMSLYNNFLKTQIDEQFIENKMKRDKNHYHITIINTMQFNKLKKEQPEKLAIFLNNFLGTTFDFFSYGIGNAQKANNEAWFAVVESSELNHLRNNLELTPQDLHITMAFHEKDVFGVAKNKESVIYDNQNLWENFVIQLYPNNKKLKIK